MNPGNNPRIIAIFMNGFLTLKRSLDIQYETDNTKKVSELKSKYEAGTLSYDTKDVAKAFLKEAVGIY